MKGIIIYEILIPSLQKMYRRDFDNIRFGVSERNICARLAHHMENVMHQYDRTHDSTIFKNYFADVEYNRMGDGYLKHFENSEHKPQYMVSDILIQTRGYDRNLLAVEMKRKGNYRNVREDKERLKSLVSSPTNYNLSTRCVHDTLIGAFITYSPIDVKVEIFENINGTGQKTNELYFICTQHDGIGYLVSTNNNTI